MDLLTVFGFFVVTLMMVFYALESRSPWFTLLFGGSCLASAVYGGLSGTWPFAAVETVWGGIAFYKWYCLPKP